MKIGIVGLGVVGQTVFDCFKEQNYTMSYYDVNHYNSNINHLVDADFVFVCVPTDTVDGHCDTSHVENTIKTLSEKKFSGIVVIKSTVIPGTTQKLISTYSDLTICFVPEFLREKHAISDFKYSQEILIVGTSDLNCYQSVANIYNAFVKKSVQMSPTEAELAKYFVNTYNAFRITFANVFYDVCFSVDSDYSKILSAVINKSVIGHDHYLKCHTNLRGYQGKCLPKDIEAFSTFLNQINCQNNIFPAIIYDNKRYTQ